MECATCVFLGIKIKPGPIERYKLENFGLDNTIEHLRNEAEKKTDIPSALLELIHHGKILKDTATLQDSGVKNGDMVHVVKRKVKPILPAPVSYTDTELHELNASLRSLGCSPSAPGWIRAMQLLNDESVMAQLLEESPTLANNSVVLSLLHEVELLAALGANTMTMRCATAAHPELYTVLRHLIRLVHAQPADTSSSNDNASIASFSYSLEAVSDDDDAEEQDNDDGERTPITQEQLSAALQATRGIMSTLMNTHNGADALARLLHPPAAPAPASPAAATPSGSGRGLITPEMFSEAISEVINRGSGARVDAGTQMEDGTAAAAASGAGRGEAGGEEYGPQLRHMREMGLLDEQANVHALQISAGDVNAAINLIFNGVIGDY